MVAKPATGPKYGDLIKVAIVALKDRTGSSQQAITKYIIANYPNAKNVTALKGAFKKGVESGALVKNKGSFKVAAKPKAAPKKKVAAKPKAAPKKKVVKKAAKPAAKKKVKKASKPAAKKPAVKKTIKKASKPAAKKAKKAAPKKKAAKK